MSRLKKPASERLDESINTPVRRSAKQLAVRIARAKGVSLTVLSRGYIEQGLEKDGRLVETAVASK